MAQQAQVTLQLSWINGNNQFRASNTRYTKDLSKAPAAGPYPGGLKAQTSLTLVDLSQLDGMVLGICYLWNFDTVHDVYYGAYDPERGIALLPFKLGPGCGAVVELSPLLSEEATPGTGTGSVLPGAKVRLALKADIAACQVFVGAFPASPP